MAAAGQFDFICHAAIEAPKAGHHPKRVGLRQAPAKLLSSLTEVRNAIRDQTKIAARDQGVDHPTVTLQRSGANSAAAVIDDGVDRTIERLHVALDLSLNDVVRRTRF